MVLFTRKKIFCAVLIVSTFVFSESTPTNIGNLTQNEDATIQSGTCNLLKPECKNGGTCAKQGNSSHCTCRNGTSGDFCEIVEECDKNLCGNSFYAKCYFDVLGGKAVCKCLDKDSIFDHNRKTCRRTCNLLKPECKNGGTCVNQGNSNHCTCRNGTSGDLCEIVDECQNNLCGNFRNPKCYFDVLEGKAACKCLETDSIFDHNQKTCRSICNKQNPCRNGGKCVNVGNYSLCSCLNGTLGDLCTIVKGCMGFNHLDLCGVDFGSTCYFDVEKGKAACRCLDNDKVYDSEKKTCRKPCDASKNDCKNGGKCEGHGNYKFCSCRNGTYGDFCESVRDCDRQFFCGFSRDTKCYFDESKGTAACKCIGRNFYNAEKKICTALNDSSTACKTNCGGGTCVKIEEGEVCVCPQTHFYNGKTCIDKCNPNPCQNGGMCYLYKLQSTCLCMEPYSGIYCESGAKRRIYSVVIYCAFAAGIIVAIIASCCALRSVQKLRDSLTKPNGA